MSIAGIGAVGVGAVGFTPSVTPTLTTKPAEGAGFSDMLANGLEQLQGLHQSADQLAVRAATGDLANLHDYTLAATEASVATQLTVAVRNKAVEAFHEIMRMQV